MIDIEEIKSLKKGDTIYEYSYTKEVKLVLISDVRISFDDEKREILEFEAKVVDEDDRSVNYLINTAHLNFAPDIYVHQPRPWYAGYTTF